MSKKPCKKCPKLDGAEVYLNLAVGVSMVHPFDGELLGFDNCNYRMVAIEDQPRTYRLERVKS